MARILELLLQDTCFYIYQSKVIVCPRADPEFLRKEASMDIVYRILDIPYRKCNDVFEFERYEDFRTLKDEHSELMGSGIEIHIQGYCTPHEAFQASNCGNLQKVSIGGSAMSMTYSEGRYLSEYLLPILETLRLSVIVDVPLPLVRELCIEEVFEFSTKFITGQPDKLELCKIEKIVFDKKLPLSLSSLYLEDIHVEGGIDLAYMWNLHCLAVNMIEFIDIKLPPNLTQLNLFECVVGNLKYIYGLRLLEELTLIRVSVEDYGIFDVEYPEGLKRLTISDPVVKSEFQTSTDQVTLHDPHPYVLDLQLPSALEVLTLCLLTFLSSDITFPLSLRRILFKSIDGIYYPESDTYEDVFREIEFNEELVSLEFIDCHFRQVIGTNIDSLPNLKIFTLDLTPYNQDWPLSS